MQLLLSPTPLQYFASPRQNINDLSSPQICTLAIYWSYFTDRATTTHTGQGELTSVSERVESWAQVLAKAHRELALLLLLWLLLLHSSISFSLLSYPSGSTFRSFAGGSKAPHQHGHPCTFAISLHPLILKQYRMGALWQHTHWNPC